MGVGLVINRLKGRLPGVRFRVSTWIGDRLWVCKRSLYVTGHLEVN